MTDLLFLGVALLLTLACGVFVAAEFSLTTVERSDLERAAERGERGADSALTAVRGLTFQLSGAQLGITVTGLVIGMLSKPAIATLLAGPLDAMGLSRTVADSVAVVLGTAISTVVLMVVGELVPKNWAISDPLVIAKKVATAQRGFSAAFKPFIRHLNNTANHMVRRMGLEPAEELASARGPQELVALARHSAKEGALEPDTAELFVRTLNLADLTAENVMTPRVQVIALEVQSTAEDVANATRATGLSRFPVYRGSLDSVVGVAHIKDVLTVPAERRPRHPVSELVREPLLVPTTLTVDRLLDRLSGRRTMAVVIDEYGGTAGVVTLEDIVEEVVGEVRDEHDPHGDPRPGAGRHRRRGPQRLSGRRRRPHRPAEADRPVAAGGPVRDPRRADRHRTRPDTGRRRHAGGGRLADGRARCRRPPRGPGAAARPPPRQHRRAGEGGPPMTALQLFVGLLTLVVNAFFVGAEFALISVRRSQIEPYAERGDRRATSVLWGLQHVSALLAAAQLGITLCTLVLGAVAEPAIAHLLEPVFHAVGISAALIHPISFVIALSLATYLHMLFGEMVPKNIALAEPVRSALMLGPPLVALTRALRPVIFAINALANALLKVLRVETKDEVAATFSDDQLAKMVEDSRAAGLLDERAQERLRDALELGRRPVRDVVLPVEKVVSAMIGDHPRGTGAAGRRFRLLPLPRRRRHPPHPRLSARQGRAGRHPPRCPLPGVRAAPDRTGQGLDAAGRRADGDAADPVRIWPR